MLRGHWWHAVATLSITLAELFLTSRPRVPEGDRSGQKISGRVRYGEVTPQMSRELIIAGGVAELLG